MSYKQALITAILFNFYQNKSIRFGINTTIDNARGNGVLSNKLELILENKK